MFVAAARIADLRAEIARTINSKEIRGIGAAKLVGRLMFTLSWAAGSFGKAVLQPLFAVSQRPKHGRTPPQWSRPPGSPVFRTGVRARKTQATGLPRVPPGSPPPDPHMDGSYVCRGRQQRRLPSRLHGLPAGRIWRGRQRALDTRLSRHITGIHREVSNTREDVHRPARAVGRSGRVLLD